MIEALESLWQTILDVTSMFVIPDWNDVIALLPILIFLGVVGPLITFLMLGILVYQARKPRVAVSIVEGPQVAERDADGAPVFPVGRAFCRRDRLVYPTIQDLCDTCREELAVICPMCSLGRPARIDTCPNCGLVLNIRPSAVVVRKAAGPKPGGAAVA